MSTEIPVLYSQIKKEFDTALKNAAEGEYVPKPKLFYWYAKVTFFRINNKYNINNVINNLKI